jgi:sodium-dependent dicarboxylate transporter 2/3/5
VGTAVYRTGAAEWVSIVSFSRLDAVHPIGQVFLVVLGVCLMKVLFSSNTLTGIIVVPLMIALSKQLGISSALLAIPAGITSSLSFILVTSAPANVILYAAGYFSIKDMAKAGLIMTIWASAAVTISVLLFGRFCGIDAF